MRKTIDFPHYFISRMKHGGAESLRGLESLIVPQGMICWPRFRGQQGAPSGVSKSPRYSMRPPWWRHNQRRCGGPTTAGATQVALYSVCSPWRGSRVSFGSPRQGSSVGISLQAEGKGSWSTSWLARLRQLSREHRRTPRASRVSVHGSLAYGAIGTSKK